MEEALKAPKSRRLLGCSLAFEVQKDAAGSSSGTHRRNGNAKPMSGILNIRNITIKLISSVEIF